jgi:shikimate kinase
MRRDLVSGVFHTPRIACEEMKRPPPIVITGFMGCGKSKVARELARRCDAVMVDLDDWITVSEGRSPAQLINEDGERVFRTIESNALRELLQRGGAGVIALGGGAWIEEPNRNLIKQFNCTSIWLDVPFDLCWERIVTAGEDRPLGRTREQAEALYVRRRPYYELAHIHIKASPDEDFPNFVSRIEQTIRSVRG